MGNSRAPRPDPRFAAGVILVAALLWVAIGSNVIGMAYERDYLNLYTGSQLARTGHFGQMYDFDLQKATEDALVPGLKIHFPFVRPPFYALLLAPLSLLPVKTAFPVWIALQIAGMMVVWVWAWKRFGPDSAVYCAFFLPTSLGIAHGQDCIVLLLVMLGAWTLLERKRDGAAGLLLALALFKFHLFLLLPLAIFLRGRWRLLAGYVGGGAALAAFSLLLAGPAGLREYVNLLTRKDIQTLSPSPEMMVGFNSIAVNAGLDLLAVKAILFAAGIALVLWSARKARDEAQWFWTAVIGSMLLSPHTYEYDLSSLLIPGLIAVFSASDRRLRFAGMAALIPLPYFCTIAGAPWAIAPSIVVVALLVTLSGVLPMREENKAGVPAPAAVV